MNISGLMDDSVVIVSISMSSMNDTTVVRIGSGHCFRFPLFIVSCLSIPLISVDLVMVE